MSATTVKLLEAAVDIAGGRRALADQLGISEVLLAAFLADMRPLPDALLLRTVDLILEDRQTRLPARNPSQLGLQLQQGRDEAA